MKRSETKLAAVIGGSAIMALGVLGGTIMQTQQSPASVTSSEMSTGVTITKTPDAKGSAETAAELAPATPGIKGPAPLPVEEQGLPG